MDKILSEIVDELKVAESRFPDFNSSHEGYAVILEEVDELWDEIKNNKKSGSLERQRKECVQIAAMTIRFIKMLNKTNKEEKVWE